VKYLLSVGSNIRPAENMRSVLLQMAGVFFDIKVGRFFRSPAYGMRSFRPFWNGVVLMRSDLDVHVLKAQLCQWEEESGRDRSHPNCSIRDRTLDVDIVWSEGSGWLLSKENITTLPYLRAPIASLMPGCFPVYTTFLSPVCFSFQGHLLGYRPMHIQ